MKEYGTESFFKYKEDGNYIWFFEPPVLEELRGLFLAEMQSVAFYTELLDSKVASPDRRRQAEANLIQAWGNIEGITKQYDDALSLWKKEVS